MLFSDTEKHGEVSQTPTSGLVVVTRGALWLALKDNYLEIRAPSS